VRLVLTDAAKADIRTILRRTRTNFGDLQVPRYRALITEARQRVREDPGLGHAREGLPPDWRLFHISQAGRRASHFLLYTVNTTEQLVVVLRVLHDAMDIPKHWPSPG
jgi:plasmid stabilization system protein ParE